MILVITRALCAAKSSAAKTYCSISHHPPLPVSPPFWVWCTSFLHPISLVERKTFKNRAADHQQTFEVCWHKVPRSTEISNRDQWVHGKCRISAPCSARRDGRSSPTPEWKSDTPVQNLGLPHRLLPRFPFCSWPAITSGSQTGRGTSRQQRSRSPPDPTSSAPTGNEFQRDTGQCCVKLGT